MQQRKQIPLLVFVAVNVFEDVYVYILYTNPQRFIDSENYQVPLNFILLQIFCLI